MFRFIAFLCLSVLMTSCLTVSKLDIEMMRPAKVILPAEIRQLGVVSLVPSKTYLFKRKSKTDTLRLDPGKTLTRELLLALQEQNRIVAKNGDTLGLRYKLYPFSDSIPPAVLEYASSSLKVDSWLVIEKLSYRDTIELSSEILEENWRQHKLAAKYWLDAKWKLYSKDGNIIDSHYSSLADQIVGYYPSVQIAAENVPTKKEILEYASRLLIEQYIKRLLPYWERKERMIYSGTFDFTKAEGYLKNNQIDKAAFIYRNYIRHKDNNLKIAALHNMAIAAEMKGSMEAALEWAKESNKLYRSDAEQKYIEELELRLKEESVIKKQLLIP